MRWARFLLAALLSIAGLAWQGEAGESAKTSAELFDVDYRSVVSRADLVYRSPASHPAEGTPIGNGVMGTMVWTTPEAVRFQLNRVDVFAVNKNHAGEAAAPLGPAVGPIDACGGIAQVTLDVGGPAFQAGGSFLQRLSLYDAEVRIEGDRVRACGFVASDRDVLVLEIDDQRPQPLPLRLSVATWREPLAQRGAHRACCEFLDRTDDAVLRQQFAEKDHFGSAALAARVVGSSVRVEASSSKVRTLCVPAQRGRRTILVTTAASSRPKDDPARRAIALVDKASAESYDALRTRHLAWWHAFWSRTFLHLESPDGLAAFLQRVRSLHLYYMASSSRGSLPPKWNGSIFTTDGDRRAWGSQYWVWTVEAAYYPLCAADAVDLTDPFFRMYTAQLPDCRRAAAQRWGARGAFFAETTPYDGPVVLPDDLAEEFRSVFTGRKSPAAASARLKAAACYESQLNCSVLSTQVGPYSYISHVASSGAELAVEAWRRFRTTGDLEFLRRTAYPLMRDTAEFYRSLAYLGDDGRYHLRGTNVHEQFWGVGDGIMDLAAIRGTVPPALRAAEILQTDRELQPLWKAFLDRLADYPMGRDPRAKALRGGALADDLWAAGYLGNVNDPRNLEDVWLNPVFPFEDWTLATREASSDRIVRGLLAMAPRLRSTLSGEGLNTAIRTPLAAVRAGDGERLPAMAASYYVAFAPTANGMGLFEGFGRPENQAHSVEALGVLSTMVQDGLMQSVAPRPGQPEVIVLLPAWPKAWRASFRLLARGGFLVAATAEDGRVARLEIRSRLGETCRLRNPWGGPCRLAEIGGPATDLSGDLLCFPTRKGAQYQLFPAASPPPPATSIRAGEETAPASFRFTMPGGRVVQATLGRPR